MENKKQFLGVLIGVLICVLFFGAIVYATTTIGNNITVGGTLTISKVNQNGQVGIYATASADTNNDTVYGMYVDIDTGTDGATYGGRYAYGSYYNIHESGGNYKLPTTYGTYVYLDGKNASALTGTLYGHKVESSGFVGTGGLSYVLYEGILYAGSPDQLTNYGLKILGHTAEDGSVNDATYINLQADESKEATDEHKFIYITDSSTAGAITTGEAFGLYVDLDNTNWDNKYSIFITNDSGVSHFGSEVTIGPRTGNIPTTTNWLSVELSVVGTASISEDLWASGSFQFGGGQGIATTSYSRLGSSITGHSLSNADDLMIGGELEVNETAYFDGLVSASDTNGILVGEGTTITSGTASPSADCKAGSLYIRAGQTDVDNVLYVCSNTNEWDNINLTTGP